MEIKKILEAFNEVAPLSLSFDAQKNCGHYDNSGLILDCAEETDSVVFALDLTNEVVDYAVSVGAKLIITHHPAIYRGIKSVSGTYVKAISAGITVYSAHLNLDAAVNGIDDTLASLAGATETEIIDYVNETRGFGRKFSISPTTAESVVNRLIRALSTDKYMFFGNKNAVVDSVATFCGAGLNEQSASTVNAQLLISADIPHHVLLAGLNSGKCILQLTHYASEAIAMKHFVENSFANKINIKCYFFTDKRFL